MDGTPELPEVTVPTGGAATFALLVKLEMDRRGWNVRELARQARVSSHWTVHNALSGKDISMSNALKIAAALGLSTGDLGQAGDLK